MSNPTNVVPFEFEGNDVRVIQIDGDPWFVLSDVCKVLEIGNPSDAARRLDDDEVTLDTIEGSHRPTNIINESGLYSLVLTSRKPQAKRFKKWVTSEVLPSIRKTGSYQVPLTREQQIAQALVSATEIMEEQKQTIEYQSKKIEEDAPKVGFYDDVGDAKNLLTMGNAIKNMNIPSGNGGYLGRNKAFELLRGMKILQSSNAYWNQPYQQYINQGYFVVKGITLPNGIYKTTTYVTGKGFRWIHKKLTE